MNFDVPIFDKNTTDINKSVIEKNISQFENKKNIEKEENEVTNFVMEDLKNEWIIEYFPKWIEVKKIDNNVFFIIDKNTNKPYLYVDKIWNNLINIPFRYTEEWIKNSKNWNPWRAILKAGFVFWKNLELHKIEWFENWSLQIWWKIDTYSKEYYQAWKKIVRASWDIFVNTILNSDSKTKFNHNSFNALLKTGAVNKNTLEQINNKWIITNKDYQFWLDFLENKEKKEKAKSDIDKAIEEVNKRIKNIKIILPDDIIKT